MSVHQRSDGRWYVVWKKDGRAKTKHFGRGLESEKLARQFNKSLGLRSWIRRTPIEGSVKFASLVNEYMVVKENQFSKESMDNFFWKMAGVILPELGNLPALKITDSQLDKYVSKRLRSVKATTVHRELSDIQAVLNWASQRRYIAFNPVAGYSKPRRDDCVIPPPSQHELNSIMRHASNHLLRAMCLSYYTGLRPGRSELFNLTWDNVNFTDNTILVESAKKGGPRSRIIPLHPDLKQLMWLWIFDDVKYIVHYRGRPVSSVKKAWATAKRKAGITRRLRLYDLRHAFATYALRAGSDLRSTSEILGHSRIDTTVRVYQHTSWKSLQGVINRLPGLDHKKTD